MITSNVGGINFGKTRAASISPGMLVTLTRAPEPGFIFVNWTGGCAGTASTCAVTVNSNTSVQANFTK